MRSFFSRSSFLGGRSSRSSSRLSSEYYASERNGNESSNESREKFSNTSYAAWHTSPQGSNEYLVK